MYCWHQQQLKRTQKLRFLCWESSFLHLHLSPVTYSLTAAVVEAPQMTSQPVSSIILCYPQPSGTWRTPGLSIPWMLSSHFFFLSALTSSPSHCALQDGFGQIRWTGDMSIPLQFASLYDGQEVFVWSDCLLDLGTDFLVGSMVFVWDALCLAVAPHFHGGGDEMLNTKRCQRFSLNLEQGKM